MTSESKAVVAGGDLVGWKSREVGKGRFHTTIVVAGTGEYRGPLLGSRELVTVHFQGPFACRIPRHEDFILHRVSAPARSKLVLVNDGVRTHGNVSRGVRMFVGDKPAEIRQGRIMSQNGRLK